MFLWPLQVFDPKAGFGVLERKLPHWSQAGTICFITWRTLDFMPKSDLNRWHADREDWLRRHGINPKADDWKSQLRELAPGLQGAYVRTFSGRWHRSLGACHGECVLKRSQLSQIVSDSLLKFDGDRYELTDFLVMPNLSTCWPRSSMRRVCWLNVKAGSNIKLCKSITSADHPVASGNKTASTISFVPSNSSRRFADTSPATLKEPISSLATSETTRKTGRYRPEVRLPSSLHRSV